ncbi:MAG TPA: hypothetical protein PLL20_00690 [Phycisphaerae bacterium]|nr:hypothetical protein [Phycisphaerae bacterium]HRR85959.1 hypothetical protein [Phycisphaerae bacterium]
MRSRTRLVGSCIGAMMFLPLAGCSPPTVNSNGDRGTVLSTLTKLTDPVKNIGALNSAELQILVTQLPTLTDELAKLGFYLPPDIALPDLDDQEAEALEQFLAANGVNTFEDLADLASAVTAGLVQIPEILQDDFDAFAAQFGRPRPT